MEPAVQRHAICAGPGHGRDCRNAAVPQEGDISMPRSTSEALALLPETSVFSEWPVLFLNVGVGGRGSGTQKEVTANQVFTAPFPCPPEHLSLLGEVYESTKRESTSGCSRQGSPEPGDGTLNSRNQTTAGLRNAKGLAISALERAEEKGLFLSPCVWYQLPKSEESLSSLSTSIKPGG